MGAAQGRHRFAAIGRSHKGTLVTLLLAAFFVAALLGARGIAQAAAEHDQPVTEQGQPATATSPADTQAQAPAEPAADKPGSESGEDFDFFSDKPVESADVVELPPEKSQWVTVGGPLALVGFFFFLIAFFWWMVPFKPHTLDINLHDVPTGVQRGIAMATVLFGIAFCFGASEIWYQLRLHGSADAYFAQMSLGKLIAFTHAHLFGFTTSFFIIGIPFSLQFNHLWGYQWVFPVGLSASVTDVASWWGIKFLAPSFEWVSMFCGVLFSLSYLFMLVALLRVLLFPEFIFVSDKDREQRLKERREIAEAARHREGDY